MKVKILKDDSVFNDCWLVYESFCNSSDLVKVCWSFDSAWQHARSLHPDTIKFYTTKKDMINDK